MSTRALIGIASPPNENGYVNIAHTILLHDGYPAHILDILRRHFNTATKVEKLISGGAIDSIGLQNTPRNKTAPFVKLMRDDSQKIFEEMFALTIQDVATILQGREVAIDHVYLFDSEEEEWVYDVVTSYEIKKKIFQTEHHYL